MEENQSSHGIPGHDAGKATDESVIRTHALLRRNPVPASPVAFFTAVALIVVFVFTWFYVRRYTASWDSQSVLADRQQIALHKEAMKNVGPVQPEVVDGAKVYAQNCAACHQADGNGMAGMFPPLAGSEWLSGNAGVPIRIVLNGLNGPISVKGETYNNIMAPLGGLKDEEIAAVLTHVRSSFGNEASEVTAEEVAAVREEVGSRGAWSADELSPMLSE